MPDQLESLQRFKNNAIDLLMQFGPKALSAILILVVGFFVARAVGKAFAKATSRLEMDVPLRSLLGRIVRIITLLVFVMIAMQNLGVELLPLIAGLSVAGAGIALAMQGVLGNLVAGFTIIFTKPFRVGEFVSMLGVEGRVETISLFSTKLSHPDRSVVVVPNRKIVGEILHNYGTIRQLNLSVNVAYNSDLVAALAAVREVLAANSCVLQDPPAAVGVSSLADSLVIIAVKPWVKITDFGSAGGDLNKAILERLRSSGLISVAQNQVRMLVSTDQ